MRDLFLIGDCMTRKQKKRFFRIVLTVALLVFANCIPAEGVFRLAVYLIPYLVIGYDILRKAFLGVVNGQVFDENFLMAIATVGAFVLAFLRTGDYNEAIAVMLFYQIGELFQSYAVGKSRENVSKLMDIRPDYANIEEFGVIERRDPESVEVGTVITVFPGEKIPIDGIVISGASDINTSALTGENLPRSVSEGDSVISGCINVTGLIKVKTTKKFDESTVSKILDLVENASSRKSRSESFITKFAKFYTPTVCICALLLSVIPPIVLFMFVGEALDFGEWIYRALTFLVVSCPCALVISIPLSFFAGIGGAGSLGILVKGANYFETLSKVDTIVFDKTGTLTKGTFEISEIYPENCTSEELLETVAVAESFSSHPIAVSLLNLYGKDVDRTRVTEFVDFGGKGIEAEIDGVKVIVGNRILMSEHGIKVPDAEYLGTVIYVAKDMSYCGCIVLSDSVKPTAMTTIKNLRKLGVSKTVLLTGDKQAYAEAVGENLGIDLIYSELLPHNKVEIVENLLSKKRKGFLAFVGDGINDAPALSRTDIGIAMGGLGSDAAIEAADVVLMDDDPEKIVTAIKLSRKTMNIVYQNTVFAIGVKALCLILGALGYTNMWFAVFADVGVMVIAVLNAVRSLFVKNYK